MPVNIYKTPYLGMPDGPGITIESDIANVVANEHPICGFATSEQPFKKGVGFRTHWDQFVAAKGYSDVVCLTENFCVRIFDTMPHRQLGLRYLGEDWLKIDFVTNGQWSLLFENIGQADMSGQVCTINLHHTDMPKGEWLQQSLKMTGVTLFCKPSFLVDALADNLDDLPVELARFARRESVEFAFEAVPFTLPMASAVHDVLNVPYCGNLRKIYVEAKAMELVSALAYGFVKPGLDSITMPHMKKADIECLHQAKTILCAEYVDPPTIPALAQRVGINQQKLKCGFKSLFGDTVFEFTQKQRLTMACKLLLGTDDTITRIAQTVGYDYSCNFSTAFKAHFGVSPKEYRLKH